MEHQIADLSNQNLKLEKLNSSQKLIIEQKEQEAKSITNTLIDQLQIEKDLMVSKERSAVSEKEQTKNATIAKDDKIKSLEKLIKELKQQKQKQMDKNEDMLIEKDTIKQKSKIMERDLKRLA